MSRPFPPRGISLFQVPRVIISTLVGLSSQCIMVIASDVYSCKMVFEVIVPQIKTGTLLVFEATYKLADGTDGVLPGMLAVFVVPN